MNAPTLSHQIGPGDRAAIEAITRSSGFFSNVEVEVALDVFDEAVSSNKSCYQYVVARDHSTIVGYACWGKDAQTESSFELYWIAVAAEVRSSGIGTLLLNQVEAAIRNAGGGKLFVETAGRSQYHPTRLFYKKKGYEIVASIDDYFAPGDARVIFGKQL